MVKLMWVSLGRSGLIILNPAGLCVYRLTIRPGKAQPVGYRSDGTPLLAPDEIQSWLRRPTLTDDET
jgi:hypothetical protein